MGRYRSCTHPHPPTLTHIHPHPPTPSQKKVTPTHTQLNKGHTHPHLPHPAKTRSHPPTPTQTQPKKGQTQTRNGHIHPHLVKKWIYPTKFSRKCREKKIFYYPLGNQICQKLKKSSIPID